MQALFLMIPITLIIGVIVLILFVWAGKKDQFDDIEGPKYRIMDDDDEDD